MILPAIAPALALLAQLIPAQMTAPSPSVAANAPATASSPVKRSRHVRHPHAKGDPFERYNRYFFSRQQGFDRHFLRPVALGYKHVVPNLLRTGLRNFFRNLGEPLVFLNYVLQLKPGKAAETAARFAFNSTLGLGGTVDVAKSPVIRLPHRPNGFGDTLGYYGVGPGPYIFLPLLGPTTLRDLFGGQGEALIEPFLFGTPFDTASYQVTRAISTGLDARAEADGDLKAILGDAVDPYATFRSVFLQDRAGEIADLHGPARASAGPSKELGDPLADPATTTTDARDLESPLIDPAAIPPAPSTIAPSPPTDAPKADAAPAGTGTPVPPTLSSARELQDPLDDPAATPAAAPAKPG